MSTTNAQVIDLFMLSASRRSEAIAHTSTNERTKYTKRENKTKQNKRDRSLLPVELLHFSLWLRRKTALFVLGVSYVVRRLYCAHTYLCYLHCYLYEWEAWMNDINWAKIDPRCLFMLCSFFLFLWLYPFTLLYLFSHVVSSRVCACVFVFADYVWNKTKSNCTDFDEKM